MTNRTKPDEGLSTVFPFYFFNSSRSLIVRCWLLTAVVQSSITGPDRRVAVVGSSLHLTCWTDSTDVCWEYYPDRTSIPQTIYTGQHLNGQYTDSHRVTIGDGNVTLSVTSVQLRDAGVYQCRQCSAVQSVDIDVIVLGTEHWYMYTSS